MTFPADPSQITSQVGSQVGNQVGSQVASAGSLQLLHTATHRHTQAG